MAAPYTLHRYIGLHSSLSNKNTHIVCAVFFSISCMTLFHQIRCSNSNQMTPFTIENKQCSQKVSHTQSGSIHGAKSSQAAEKGIKNTRQMAEAAVTNIDSTPKCKRTATVYHAASSVSVKKWASNMRLFCFDLLYHIHHVIHYIFSLSLVNTRNV